jgi:hypothetical protein
MPLFDYSERAPSDVLDEDRAERRRQVQMRHWCPECRGDTTSSNSPCFIEIEPDVQERPVISPGTWQIVGAVMAKVNNARRTA